MNTRRKVDTHSIHIVQLILVLESGFCPSNFLIDLQLHPGLDLREVRHDRDQRQKPPSSCGQT